MAKSAADGYTILIANNTIAIQAAMPQALPFDVMRDFTPIGVIASTPVALAVHIRTSTPEQFAALIKYDVAKWSQVVREGTIKPE